MSDDPAIRDAENTAPSRHPGLRPPWKPGQTGNPGGRPKGPSIAAAILRNLSEADADEIARQWIKDAKRSKLRVSSRESLIERTDGKVPQRIAGDPDGSPIVTSVTVRIEEPDQ